MTDGATAWFALVDGASDPTIAPLARACRDHCCLLSGQLARDLAAASPYLARVDPREPLMHQWQERGRGRHWGLLIEAELDLAGLRKLLRTFLQARLPDGEVVTFRFYDPRVFRSYIRSAPPAQWADWFRGVRRYVVEGDGGGQHSFALRDGRLFDGDAPAALLA